MKADYQNPSLKKNFTYSLLYQFLILILPMITLPYISRVFGSEKIGIYTYAQTFANYFVLFAMLGILTHGTRAIAAVRENLEERSRTFWELFVCKLFFSVMLTAVYMLCCTCFITENRLIYLLQFFYVVSTVFNINWFCFGMESFRLVTLRDTLIQVVSTILVFSFVKGKEDLWIYTLILSGAQLFSALLAWPYAAGRIKRVRVRREGILQHVKPLWILFIPILAESVYYLMDKLMLGRITTAREVGFYECAVRIIVVPGVIIAALNNTAMPRIVSLVAAKSRKDADDLMDKMILICTMLGCAMAFGIAAVGQDFAVWFYGQEFERTGFFLVLLSPVVLFSCISITIRMQYIIPTHRDNLYVISIVSGAAVNLLLNLVLIPRLWGTGVAIGTLAAEFMVAFLQFFLCRKTLKLHKYMKDLLVFAIIGAIMLAAVRGIRSVGPEGLLGLVIQVAAGAVLYLFLSFVYIRRSLKRAE